MVVAVKIAFLDVLGPGSFIALIVLVFVNSATQCGPSSYSFAFCSSFFRTLTFTSYDLERVIPLSSPLALQSVQATAVQPGWDLTRRSPTPSAHRMF